MAEIPGKRPNGCSPTPMIATSSMAGSVRHGAERVHHAFRSLGIRREGDRYQLHAVSDPHRLLVHVHEAGFDSADPLQLDVADEERDERLGSLVTSVRRAR